MVLFGNTVDTDHTNWWRSGDDPLTFKIRESNHKNKKSNELIFDFQFINNIQLIHHLQQIDVIIERAWSELKGIPLNEILMSCGAIEFELDFSKKINSIVLNSVIGGPIVFKPMESKRFNLHLLKFTEKCRGNMAELKFRFKFDSVTIESEKILLDF